MSTKISYGTDEEDYTTTATDFKSLHDAIRQYPVDDISGEPTIRRVIRRKKPAAKTWVMPSEAVDHEASEESVLDTDGPVGGYTPTQLTRSILTMSVLTACLCVGGCYVLLYTRILSLHVL
jgi:hypothetical protein